MENQAWSSFKLDRVSVEGQIENGDEEAQEESTLNPEAMSFELQGPKEIPDSILAEPVAEAVETQEPQESGETGEGGSSLASDEDDKEEADYAEILGRRSTRERVPPKRLTYPSLGSRLTEVMQSLLRGLDKAFTEALTVDSMPYIYNQLQPNV